MAGAIVALERLDRAVARLEVVAARRAGVGDAELAALRAEHTALQVAASRVAQRLDSAIAGLAVTLRDTP